MLTFLREARASFVVELCVHSIVSSVFWGKQNAEQNWFSSLAFHLIVGAHALWFLWVLIHRRWYFALKALCSNIYQIWLCYTYYKCGNLLLLAPAVCVVLGDCHSFALVGLERLFPFTLCAAWFLGSGGVLTCIALHVDSCSVSGNAMLGVKWTAVPYSIIAYLFFLFPLFQCVILYW